MQRPLLQRTHMNDNKNRARKHPGRSRPRNGPSNNKRRRVRRRGADQRADLEDEDGGQVDPFRGVEAVDLAEEEHEAAAG